MPVLCSKDMNTEEFIQLVQTYYQPNQNLILMAFSPTKAVFEPLKPEVQASFLRETDQGRIFSPKGELKWRRMDGKIRVVYLGDAPSPQELTDFSSETDKLEARQSELILWGVRTDIQNEWIEQQIPQRFKYPITGKPIFRGRVRLVTEDWLDSYGFVRFSRYHSLEEIPGEE